MEKQLKCVLLLSLKEMALRRVAVLLWNDSDILASISKFRFDKGKKFEIQRYEEEWRENIEDKIKDKVLKLKLPKFLMKQVIDIARPISLQIIKWKENQESQLSDEIGEIILPDSPKLCWNTAGLIEYRKTSEELVRCNKLNVVQRYELACINCLEDYIPLLWEELSEEKKDYFYSKGSCAMSFSLCLDICWALILKGQLSRLDYLRLLENCTTFNQWAFKDSAERGNKTAAEYFFQKLTHEEREASLMRTAHAVLSKKLSIFQTLSQNEQLSDVFFYLLSVMTPEQQMEIFKARPIEVLWCFLHWPRQDLFLDNAGLFWTFLTPNQYGHLLQFIINEALIFSDPYFLKLFPEFFKQSPLDFKKYFVDHGSAKFLQFTASNLLSVYLESEDSESIKVIFRNVDAADRLKLIFHKQVVLLFQKFILKKKWHMVEVCLREAMLSEEHRKRLKEIHIGVLESNDILPFESVIFKGFFEFLDETHASTDKVKKGQKRKHENCCPE